MALSQSNSVRARGVPQGASRIFVLLVAGILSACSAGHYRREADRQVYGIIQAYEHRIFGATNVFTISTRYSGRDPASITPAEVLGERSAAHRRVLGLEEALDLAVEHSREYQTEKEQLYLAALSLTGARYEFSPQFFATTAPAISGTPAGSDVGTIRSQVGVSQFLRTGGRLSVALANDLLRYFAGFSGSGQGTRSSAINTLSVQLTQPLLRGFGRNDPAVEALTQAERNVVYAIRSYTQYQKQFAVNIVNEYFGLLGGKDEVRNNYTNYLRRVETTQYLQARVEGKREQQSSLLDARSAELTARIGYINSVANYLNDQAAFKITLGLPLTEDVYFDDTDLADLITAGLVGVGIDHKVAFRYAVSNHMDILNAIDRFEDSQRKVRIAVDQLKPELGLVSTASLQSESPYDYARFDINKLQYSAGLTLDLPVDRVRERNTYRATLIAFESQVRNLSLTLDNFRDRIDRGLRTLEQRRLNYLNSQTSLDVARRRVEADALRLEAGRVQVRDLRESQDSLIAAQNQVTSTLISYLQARLQLLLDIGVLNTQHPEFWLTNPLADWLTPEMRGTTPLQMPGDDVNPPDHYLEPPSS